MIDGVPNHLDATTRRFLSQVREALLAVPSTSQVPLTPPTGLTATGINLAIQVRFIPSNAMEYVLYVSDSPDITKAHAVDLGGNTIYTDYLQAAGVHRWYWVQGRAAGILPSRQVGPVTAVSVGVNTPQPAAPDNALAGGSGTRDATLDPSPLGVYGWGTNNVLEIYFGHRGVE